MRFLFTTHQLSHFSGSEINALQLGQALQSLGHTADLATLFAEGPVVEHFATAGMQVIDLLSAPPRRLDYDVIWAHHAPALSELLFNWPVADARVLFSSLSAIEPLEAPPPYHADMRLLLVNAPVTKDFTAGLGARAEDIEIFPNYAPRRFFGLAKGNHAAQAGRMLVVSNHPVPELREFARLAAGRGCQVDFVGLKDRVVFVDESVLLPYDAVITIGKTVQYCMALKLPVYVYDHFGGHGYLHSGNFESCYAANFSGRLSNRFLSAEALLEDVIGGYAGALDNLDWLYAQAAEHFCLETNLERLLPRIQALPVTDLAAFKARHPLAKLHNDVYIRKLRQHLSGLQGIAERDAHIYNLQAVLDQRDAQLQRLLNSRGFRALNALTAVRNRLLRLARPGR